MTLWDTLVAARRRWYIAVAGVLCTLAALYGIRTQPVVFYSEAEVYFLAPSSKVYPNQLGTSSLGLVTVAGVVGKIINGSHTLPKTTDPNVSLPSRGIDDGTYISLPDNGGQWSVYYNVQALEVQVAAPSPEAVKAKQAKAFTEISDTLKKLQDDEGVVAHNRITTQVLPDSPVIVAMSGERRRAEAMTLLLGALLTLIAIAIVELRSLPRRRRARADAPPPNPRREPEPVR